MAQPASGDREYFLGIEGEQSGPFPIKVIVEKIKRGTVSEDTLIWSEGMSDWEPVHSLAVFQQAFDASASGERTVAAPIATSPQVPTPSPTVSTTSVPQAVLEEKMFEPVFGEETDDGSFVRHRILFISCGIALLFVGAVAGFVLFATNKPINTKARGTIKKNRSESVRQLELNRAISQLMIDPQQSISMIKALAKTNPDDTVGQEAKNTLVDYYLRGQNREDAGRFLMEIKKPEEAIKYFLDDPSSVSEAEAAYFAAFESAPLAKKKEYLLQDIRLLLNPLRETNRAIERIHLFEKTFPGQPHPFTYYLRSPDEKIADLFQRISFHFVQNLLAYLNTELPQITFVDRPLVEVKKSKTGDYRIVGTYRGDVMLRNDKLSDIYFAFWLVNDIWYIVDTNLTKERQRYAAVEKERRQKEILNAAQMLRYIETVFQTQFPKSALHEGVTRATTSVKTRLPE